MRIVLFIIWIVLGFCLLLPGCRASISAGKLEAAFSLGFPGVDAPAIQEVGLDKDSKSAE